MLGAPTRHFPSFMPPTALQGGQQAAAGKNNGGGGGSGSSGASPAEAGARAGGAWVPTLAVTAGPTDLLVSELFSGVPLEAAASSNSNGSSGGSRAAPAGAWVQLSMQDVPGVWTTSNHKVGAGAQDSQQRPGNGACKERSPVCV